MLAGRHCLARLVGQARADPIGCLSIVGCAGVAVLLFRRALRRQLTEIFTEETACICGICGAQHACIRCPIHTRGSGCSAHLEENHSGADRLSRFGRQQTLPCKTVDFARLLRRAFSALEDDPCPGLALACGAIHPHGREAGAGGKQEPSHSAGRSTPSDFFLRLPRDLGICIVKYMSTADVYRFICSGKQAHQLAEAALLMRALEGGFWLPSAPLPGFTCLPWISTLLWLEARRAAARNVIAAGYLHSVLVSSDHQLLICGSDGTSEDPSSHTGVLGQHVSNNVLPARSTVTSPSPLRSPGGVGISCVAAGSHHTIAVTWAGTVFVWGSRGISPDPPCPPRLVKAARKIVDVAASSDNSPEAIRAHTAHSACFAVDVHGVCFSWWWVGTIDEQEPSVPWPAAAILGHGACPDDLHETATPRARDAGAGAPVRSGDGVDYDVPRRISGLSGFDVLSVSAGESHALAVTASGAVYSWGTVDGAGLLGRSIPPTNHAERTASSQPGRVLPFCISRSGCRRHRLRAVAAAAGALHSLVITAVGEVWSWGSGLDGRHGHGGLGPVLEPRLLPALRGHRVTSISAGYGHSLVLTDTGAVFSWGYNANGELGHGDAYAGQAGSENDPILVDPDVYNLPTRIAALAGVCVVAIAAGVDHSLAIRDDGTALAWGCAADSRLGLPSIPGFHGEPPTVREPQAYPPGLRLAIPAQRTVLPMDVEDRAAGGFAHHPVSDVAAQHAAFDAATRDDGWAAFD